MKQDPFAPEYKEVIEVDAVCNQCGKVNPEGTLICKTCGNNLRDQRMLRLAADQQLQGDEEGEARRSFLKGAVTVLALLVLIWIGMNVGRITSAMTAPSEDEAGMAVEVHPYIFWTGADKALYERLAGELADKYPSESNAQTARLDASPGVLTDGIYALFEKRNGGDLFVGGASIAVEADTIRFSASLTGGVEIRGFAKIQDTVFSAPADQVGVQKEKGKYAPAEGSAMAQGDGSYLILARGDTWRGQILAYRLTSY